MDYIEIKGYKSIKSEKIELNQINILIGANGSGKSNFISFFDFLNRLYNRNLNEYIALNGGENKILHKGQKNTDLIEFKVEFDNGNNGYSAKLKLGVEGLIFTDERLIYRRDSGADISRSQEESRLKITDNFRAKYVIRYLTGFRKYHFHDTSDKSPFTHLSNIENDIYYLYFNGSNLAAFLYNIYEKHKIVYNNIIKTIQSIAPYFSDFYFNPNTENLLRLQWKDKFSDTIYGATDLSDGTIRFIALTVLFLQPDLPDTIIIDEPELGLHPAAIAKLAGMIKSVSLKKTQVIIATQSTDLISHFAPEDILTVDQIDGCSKFTRLNRNNLESWLEDYTIDDLWKRNIINSGQPNI
ncbi:AAA family ATPase [Flavobacterium sp. J27]|uniref:AAA family ATPase n=1 Tax=Flavobacterium sp. J27 TaxID=2060419 RepID=UPI001031C6A8|nr:AAA family ATPase [Flavobacterium sp. J27]